MKTFGQDYLRQLMPARRYSSAACCVGGARNRRLRCLI